MLCLQDEVGRRLETSHGELVLDVEQGTVFSVSQYRGQPGLGYFCLEAERARLYHRGMKGGDLREGWGPWVVGAASQLARGLTSALRSGCGQLPAAQSPGAAQLCSPGPAGPNHLPFRGRGDRTGSLGPQEPGPGSPHAVHGCAHPSGPPQECQGTAVPASGLPVGWGSCLPGAWWAGPHRADCAPPPGVPGDTEAPPGHPTPLHGSTRTELALPGECK